MDNCAWGVKVQGLNKRDFLIILNSVCWLYTKKRSANFGIPLNGWYQSNAGGWELIEDVKISMRD